ncbi:MAG: aminoacyl-tRNA hydrolase [Acidimicrobiia bacterium]|nr:aminoacyl-tRNA hydrolase [Acidimicrobiia bacterium]
MEPGSDAPEGSVLRISRTLAIPHRELTWRFTGSGGPGGQHANTANTKVDLRFDVEASEALGPQQRQRLLSRYGREVKVVESGQRSQARNRDAALGRLADLIRDGLRVERRRVATKPGRGAVERRLQAKRQRSDTKKQRRSRNWD